MKAASFLMLVSARCAACLDSATPARVVWSSLSIATLSCWTSLSSDSFEARNACMQLRFEEREMGGEKGEKIGQEGGKGGGWQKQCKGEGRKNGRMDGRMDGGWASYSAISPNLSGLKFASDSRSSLFLAAAKHRTCRESAK
jgi:hypothetical protein